MNNLEKVIITGVNGFVGSHLADLLLNKQFKVYGTKRASSSIENLDYALRLGLHLRCVDIIDFERVKEVIEEIHPDYVFHVAAMTSIKGSFDDPLATQKVNVGGTIHLLESLKKRISKDYNPWIYVVLSQESFGLVHPDEVPVDEKQPYRPRSPYGASKALAHFIGNQYAEAFGMRVVMLRPFTHSGPRQGLGFLFPDWGSQIAAIEAGKKKPIILHGNLDAVRDYLHVNDVVKAYAMIMGKGIPGEVYNICSNIQTSVKSVLDEMIRQSSFNGKIITEEDPTRIRSSDTPLFVGSYQKISELTGWKPNKDLSSIVKDVLDYWREKISKNGKEKQLCVL